MAHIVAEKEEHYRSENGSPSCSSSSPSPSIPCHRTRGLSRRTLTPFNTVCVCVCAFMHACVEWEGIRVRSTGECAPAIFLVWHSCSFVKSWQKGGTRQHKALMAPWWLCRNTQGSSKAEAETIRPMWKNKKKGLRVSGGLSHWEQNGTFRIKIRSVFLQTNYLVAILSKLWKQYYPCHLSKLRDQCFPLLIHGRAKNTIGI